MSIRENSVEWQSQRESHCSVGLVIELYLETIKIAAIRTALIKDVLNKTSEKNGLCLLLSLHFSSVCNRGWWRFYRKKISSHFIATMKDEDFSSSLR